MDIRKHVATGPALTDAMEHIDFTLDGPDPANAAFSAWYNSNAAQKWGVEIEVARALIVSCPDDPAGRAWKAKMTELLAATEADTIRPFDDAIFDEATLTVLYDFEQTLRRSSPLLGVVADVVGGLNDDFTVGELLAYTEKFTVEGILVEARLLDYDTDDDAVLVPFRHIDMLRAANGEMGRVSTRDDVTGIIKTIVTAIGEVGDEMEGIAVRRGETVEDLEARRA